MSVSATLLAGLAVRLLAGFNRSVAIRVSATRPGLVDGKTVTRVSIAQSRLVFLQQNALADAKIESKQFQSLSRD